MNDVLLLAVTRSLAAGDEAAADRLLAMTPEQIRGVLGAKESRADNLLGLSESAPGPPPRPGLVWKDSTKRWVHPETGEEHRDHGADGDPVTTDAG